MDLPKGVHIADVGSVQHTPARRFKRNSIARTPNRQSERFGAYMASSRKNTQLEAALDWAHRGFDVLPLHSINEAGNCTCGRSNCASPGKHPRTPHGHRDASSDSSTIEKWFEAWPHSNVGVVPGSGRCVVIDIDPRGIEPEREAALVGQIEESKVDAPLVLTGTYGERRGRHVWFRASNGQAIQKSRLEDGVDVKAGNGYVLVPPSRHASGATYTLASGSFESIPELPTWLGEQLTHDTEGGRYQSKDPGAFTDLPISKFTVRAVEHGLTECRDELNQRETALGVARNLREARVPKPLVLILMERALLHPDATFDAARPWKQGDVAEIVETAFKGRAPDHERFAGTEQLRFEIKSLSDAVQIAQEEAEWLITDLFAKGEKGVLAGPPKSMKTFMALDLAKATTTGSAFLGKKEWSVDSPRAVLYVQEEHAPQRWAKRVVQVFDGNLDAKFFYMHRSNLALNNDEHVDALIEAARFVNAALIVIDPWQRVIPGINENDAGETQPAWDAVHRIAAELNVSVLVIHHTNKGDGELRMEMVRGSSRMTGEADLILIGRKNSDGLIELKIEGRDIEGLPDGNLSIAHYPEEAHRMQVQGITVKGNTRNSTRSTLERVLRGAERPHTTTEIVNQTVDVLGKPISRQTCESHLKRMESDGLVRRHVLSDGRNTATWEWLK